MTSKVVEEEGVVEDVAISSEVSARTFVHHQAMVGAYMAMVPRRSATMMCLRAPMKAILRSHGQPI